LKQKEKEKEKEKKERKKEKKGKEGNRSPMSLTIVLATRVPKEKTM